MRQGRDKTPEEREKLRQRVLAAIQRSLGHAVFELPTGEFVELQDAKMVSLDSQVFINQDKNRAERKKERALERQRVRQLNRRAR